MVLASRRSQSFAELRSFAQWARAAGREASGEVVAQEYRPATAEDAVHLQLREGTPVLHVLRLRGLDGEPVLLERTVYADWISPAVESIEADCPSVTQRLLDDTGLVFAYGEHVIDAVAAGARDAELLGVRRTSPLLRVRRVTTTREGRPVEWSDDRYRSDAVSFSVHNSIGNNALARREATEQALSRLRSESPRRSGAAAATAPARTSSVPRTAPPRCARAPARSGACRRRRPGRRRPPPR